MNVTVKFIQHKMTSVNIKTISEQIMPYSHYIYFIRIIIKIASAVKSYGMLVMHYEKCLWHMVTTLLKLQFICYFPSAT